MMTSAVLKSLQSTLMIILMMAVFWDGFHTTVEALDSIAKSPPLMKSSFANDLTPSTDNPTTLMTTGTTGRINDSILFTATQPVMVTSAGLLLLPEKPSSRTAPKLLCAFRRCGADGLWLGRHLNETSPKGWTNYTPCFPTLVQKILDKVNEDEAEAQLKFETAVNTRTIEMVGIVSSFLFILAAIVIFKAFPSLQNRRTVIHRNLFYALLMEVTVRMILYTQQSHSFDGVDPLEEDSRKGIEYFPYVCEGAYVLLEYSRLVVYGWMLIEGIFLNTLISANTLRNEIPISYFYIGGWGGPAIDIVIWATVVGRHYSEEPLNTCWYGYNYLLSYYIIQGPILAIILLNMLFLGTIMSVIIMKLRRTNDSELRKIQKTIRATLILLPLLGIINIFNLFDYPLDGSSTGFAIWAYFTHFFRSFQGVFISFIYCFSNGEVRKAIKKKFERQTWFRFDWLDRRRGALAAVNPRQRPIFAITDNDNMELTPMPLQTCPSSTHIVSDIEAGTSQIEAMAQRDDKAKPALDISMNVRTTPPTTVPIPYVFDGRGVSIHLPTDEKLAQLTSITLNISTPGSQDLEPKPEAPNTWPKVLGASTSTLSKLPEVVDAATSPLQVLEPSCDDQATYVYTHDGATWQTESFHPDQSRRMLEEARWVDPGECELHRRSEEAMQDMRRRQSGEARQVDQYDCEVRRRSEEAWQDDEYDSEVYRPSEEVTRDTRRRRSEEARQVDKCDCELRKRQPGDRVTFATIKRSLSIESTHSSVGIPPFDRPPAVRKAQPQWYKCVCGVSNKKKVKRSTSLDDTRKYRDNAYARYLSQSDRIPVRSSGGCVPHTSSSHHRTPFVRPGLVTRDSIKQRETCL